MFSAVSKTASDNSGYAIVEAVIVLPAVILIILGIISVSLEKYGDVADSARRHTEDAVQWFSSDMPHAEDLYRVRRIFDEDKT